MTHDYRQLNLFPAIRRPLSRRQSIVYGLLGVSATIVLWCWSTYTGIVKPLFLPTPTALIQSINDFNAQGWLFPSIINSVRRVAQALLLVSVIGVPLGLLMGAYSEIDALLSDLMNAGKSIPMTGILGLIVLWFSIGEQAKLIFLFITAIFYIVILVRNAIVAVDDKYLAVAYDLGASNWNALWRVLIPAALPKILEAVAVCSGLMWSYIVLAEFINSSESQLGLGYLIYIGSRTQSAGKVFAAVLIIAVISAVSDYILRFLFRKLTKWNALKP